MKNQQTVGVNRKQKLYWIQSGNSYSSYGFDVLLKKRNALAVELNRPDLMKASLGTLKAYSEYQQLVVIVYERHLANGFKSKTGLTPELIGYEGNRIEATNCDGEKVRFIVGKSTGHIPCHLEIKRSDSFGGGSVYGSPFTGIRIIKRVR